MNNDRDFEKGSTPSSETPKEQNAIENEEIVIIPVDDDEDNYLENETFINNEENKTISGETPNTIAKDKLNNISSHAPSGFKEKFSSFWLKNNKKNVKIFGISLLAVIILAGAMIGVHIYKLVDPVKTDPGVDFSNENVSYTEEEDPNFKAMHDVTDASSLDNLIYQWATNGGEKISSKNVVNVMLFGVDSTDGSMKNARSDTMLLVSLNKKTKKITLVSFMRDSYTYMNINGNDRYFKINAAYNWGGPATVVETVENNYKIEIDKYVCVDFSTFPKIIDALGGVTVEVQPREANFIRRTTRYKSFPVISKPTNLKLNGNVALVFSRIRHLDSDNERTRRQREVIMSMINSAKSATTGQIDNALKNFIMPNIRTNYEKNEIVKLATEAILQKWADFDIVQILSPDDNNCKSATIHTNFVWVVDYPVEAQKVQLALYGKTNIVLENGRKSALDMLIPKNNSGSSSTSKNDSTTKSTTKPTKSNSTTNHTTTERHVTTTETGNTTVKTPESTSPVEPSTES